MGQKIFNTLTEYADQSGRSLAVDRDNGVVRGVKLIGLSSANGREYLPEALTAARAMYEGAKVNINHPAKATDPRNYGDRFGCVKNVCVKADGLYGDLHYNPKHPIAEQFAWDAENQPANVGMSHVVEGRTANRGGKVVVEEIKKVRSVDVVADPATTRGLFEQQEPVDMDELKQLQEQVAKLTGDVTELVKERDALKEQVESAANEKKDADRKAAIAAAFVEHKVDRSKVPAGLLSIIESQSAEAAVEAIKGLAESKSAVKSAAAESAGLAEGKKEQSQGDWLREVTR